jgi:hypothetical protein
MVLTRVYLLGPLLVCFYDGQTVELGLIGLGPRFIGVQPSIDMDPRPLAACQLSSASQSMLDSTYGGPGVQNDTMSPYRIRLVSITDAGRRRWPVAGDCVHFPIGLRDKTHAAASVGGGL